MRVIITHPRTYRKKMHSCMLYNCSLRFHAVCKSYYVVPYRTALNEDRAHAPILFKEKNESKMYESSRVEYSSRD